MNAETFEYELRANEDQDRSEAIVEAGKADLLINPQKHGYHAAGGKYSSVVLLNLTNNVATLAQGGTGETRQEERENDLRRP